MECKAHNSQCQANKNTAVNQRWQWAVDTGAVKRQVIGQQIRVSGEQIVSVRRTNRERQVNKNEVLGERKHMVCVVTDQG